MTWDEGLYTVCGMIAIKNVTKRKFSHENWSHEFHPPIMMYLFGLSYSIYVFIKSVLKHKAIPNFNLLYADAISLFAGHKALLVMRLPSVILSSLSCVLTYLLAVAIFQNEVIGVGAALFLALTPSFLGWSSLAMLENGVTFFYLLTILTFLKMIEYNSVGYLIISGIALGLAFGSRETGFGALLVVLPWSMLLAPKIYILAGLNAIVSASMLVLLWFLLGLAIFYVTWPWLWSNPVKQFAKNLRAVSEWTSSKPSDFKYYTRNLLASTPIPLIFLYGVGMFEAAYACIHAEANSILLLSWVILPLVVMSLPFIIKRGGVVHVIFVLPPLSILAILGLHRLSEMVVMHAFGSSSFEMVSLMLSFMVTGLLLFGCLRDYPYYIDYYNQIAKRLSGSKEKLPIGCWGEGMAEAITYVEQRAPLDSTIWIYGPKITAFYHSSRADLKKSTSDEPLFHLRAKAGVDVPVEEQFYSWRKGDLKFHFPYYHTQAQNGFSMEQLKANNISFIIVYRSYTYDPSVTYLDKVNHRTISLLRSNYAPVFTVKKKGIEFCWVYRVNGRRNKTV